MMSNEMKVLEQVLLSIREGDEIVAFWIGKERSLEGSGTSWDKVDSEPDHIGFLSKDHWPFKKHALQIGIMAVLSDLTSISLCPVFIDVKGTLLVRASNNYEGALTSAEPHIFFLDG
jgi:hypothetical protein